MVAHDDPRRLVMAFGLNNFKTTPAGMAATHALRVNAVAVLTAAKDGEPPILSIAPMIEQHLGDRKSNELVGRLIREWLGPSFKVRGRRKWKRTHGTESGSFYCHRD
jgi:hypothetical protein